MSTPPAPFMQHAADGVIRGRGDLRPLLPETNPLLQPRAALIEKGLATPYAR